MKALIDEFSNGEITVTYLPTKCINAEICARGLSEVFRTSVIPWINLGAASSQKIISQIKKCPSGALAYCQHSLAKCS